MNDEAPEFEAGPDPRASRAFSFLLAILLTFLAMTLIARLPKTVVPSWWSSAAKQFDAVWPQGWTFFDDEAEAEVIVVYRVDAEGDPELVTPIQMSPRNKWGWSRSAMSQIVETGRLSAQIPADAWYPCDATTLASCLRRTTSAYRPTVTNHAKLPTLCGPLVFSAEIPRPWASGPASGKPPSLVRRIAVTETQCAV